MRRELVLGHLGPMKQIGMTDLCKVCAGKTPIFDREADAAKDAEQAKRDAEKVLAPLTRMSKTTKVMAVLLITLFLVWVVGSLTYAAIAAFK